MCTQKAKVKHVHSIKALYYTLSDNLSTLISLYVYSKLIKNNIFIIYVDMVIWYQKL